MISPLLKLSAVPPQIFDVGRNVVAQHRLAELAGPRNMKPVVPKPIQSERDVEHD